ncbi:MAG: phosphatidylserine decarboxylase [Clostridia bacterium]|nr:phosphatidylserine decarboxylase [Clostridia bacterium]
MGLLRLYKSVFGRIILKPLTMPFVSEFAGKILDSRISAFFIKPFIIINKIDMTDFVYEKWHSFNEFFTRKINPGARIINKSGNVLISPCDGLVSVYDIDENIVMDIKNSSYTVSSLLQNESLAKEYKGGKCIVFRLTPSHYHRYCYIDNGSKGENIHIKGVYHTVQPIAVENMPVYKMNTREYTILNTENFGRVVFMEVGALMVGRICNYHQKYIFSRGEEKGKFEFGGSTIIILLDKNAAVIDKEILNCKEEYPVKMGQKIGLKKA